MNLAEFTLSSFDQMLGSFDHMLAKAEADPRGEALIAEKLADDMYPLATQVRFTTHQVVNTLNRLTGTSIATQDNDHTSLADLRAHIAETRALIRNARSAEFIAEDTPVSFDLPNGMAFEMTAAEYVRDWSLPQFYFHLMAAYSILRKAGIPLGKADFVGYVARHAKVSA